MGPLRLCRICQERTHRTIDCPRLPILRGGDLDAPVVGFRAWKVERRNGVVRLTSAYKDAAWNALQPTTAACDVGRGAGHGEAPALRCTCGLYAVYSFGAATTYAREDGVVHGAVLGWGRVYLHRDGWRAQHGQPICLALTEDRAPGTRLATEMGLRLVPAASIERYALEFGVSAAPIYEDVELQGPDAWR